MCATMDCVLIHRLADMDKASSVFFLRRVMSTKMVESIMQIQLKHIDVLIEE